jgi:hypothetical protein
MSKRIERRLANGVLLASLLIVIALSILFVIFFDVSWWVIPSLIFLVLGIMYVAFGLIYKGDEPLEYNFGPKQSSYSLGCGILLTFVGVVILNAFVVEGTSFTILFAIFLLIIGAVALVSFLGRGKKECA